MTFVFYKGLTRNLEIENTPVSLLPSIWRPKQIRVTKLGTNVSNKMLLKAAKCQGYSFYRFWVIKGGKIALLPRLGLNLKDIPINVLKPLFDLDIKLPRKEVLCYFVFHRKIYHFYISNLSNFKTFQDDLVNEIKRIKDM